jgi:serine/threonine protein kinase
MPVPMHPVELVDWLEQHELLTPDQVRELRPHLPSFPDVRLLIKELIRRNWLTPYQANQILLDRGDQLMLGALRLRERLGEGAMGLVFKAWNVKTARIVAVKTLHKDLVANARAMDRFRQEIEAAAQLDHPNIVKVLDADEIDSRPFMVMDFIDGVNLSHLVKTHGPLPVPVAVECIRQAALALEHAFQRGVIHRDIKPGNLLVVGAERWAAGKKAWPSTAQVLVKILDFGLARFDSERRYATRLTQPGSTLGTVDYMAPEQAENARDADTRADIYGLGCTLFFLLTGKPPFAGTSMAEKIAARLMGAPPSARAVRAEIPAGLDRVLERMMARQPADRYQTPAETAAALEPYTIAMPADPPPLEIPDRIPLALPVAFTGDGGAVPLAEPVSAPPDFIPIPFAQSGETAEPPSYNPFATGSTDGAPAATAGAPAAPARTAATRTGPDPATGKLNPRLVMPIVAGSAVLFLVLVSCGGYFIVSWMRGGNAKADVYPDGCGLQITEASISSDVLRPGQVKSVIVRLRRVGFHGPVDLRLDGLPAGVTAPKITVPAAAVAAEVRVTVPFGTDPSDANIRVVGKAKNLTAEKDLRLQIVPAKK